MLIKIFSLLELQNFKVCLSFPFFYIFFLASHTMAELLLINISPYSHMCNIRISDKILVMVGNLEVI